MKRLRRLGERVQGKAAKQARRAEKRAGQADSTRKPAEKPSQKQAEKQAEKQCRSQAEKQCQGQAEKRAERAERPAYRSLTARATTLALDQAGAFPEALCPRESLRRLLLEALGHRPGLARPVPPACLFRRALVLAQAVAQALELGLLPRHGDPPVPPSPPAPASRPGPPSRPGPASRPGLASPPGPGFLPGL